MDKITKLPLYYALILCTLYKKLVELRLMLLNESKIVIDNLYFHSCGCVSDWRTDVRVLLTNVPRLYGRLSTQIMEHTEPTVAITVNVNESEGDRGFELSLAVTYHILGRTCCFHLQSKLLYSEYGCSRFF
jgi:hypothetical protein